MLRIRDATARMALTFLWHGRYVGVSRLGPLRRMLSDVVSEKHPFVFSASALQSVPFEDGSLPKHGHASRNGPTQSCQNGRILAQVSTWHFLLPSSNCPKLIILILSCFRVAVWCFAFESLCGAGMRLLRPSSNWRAGFQPRAVQA